ncbi:MAG: alpha/beta hydrolase [Chroococcidiopsidaceae cyanobacterium CP_BM_RX_35]|nr:alpha/beta hydrolase [Chroococcidiopsidaceae cyanobacterium CP_BM_RX_35]
MYWSSIKSLCWTLFLGVSVSTLLYSTNANAAERVVLKYGNFQGTVAFKELNQFVQTGATTPTLSAYLKASGQTSDATRKALKAGVKGDPSYLNSLLSSWAGPILLDQVGEVVHSPSNPADQQNLRSALTQSISQSGEVTLLNAIHNYPSDSVEIEGDRLIPVYKRLSGLAKISPH